METLKNQYIIESQKTIYEDYTISKNSHIQQLTTISSHFRRLKIDNIFVLIFFFQKEDKNKRLTTVVPATRSARAINGGENGDGA